MKLFTKIFLFGMLILGLAFSASGYFLLHYSLESSLARESEFALKQYQYDKFTVQSALLTSAVITVSMNVNDELLPGDYQSFTIWEPFSEKLYHQESYPEINLFRILAEELSVPAAFFAEDHSLLYSNIQGLDPSFLNGLTENAHAWQFGRSGKGGSILVGSMLRYDSLPAVGAAPDDSQSASGADSDGTPAEGQHIYFVTQWDISKTLLQQETLRQYFLQCYLAAMGAGMILLMFLSAFLTGPLNKMSKAARRMAEGDYRERLSLGRLDEIGILAESFNQMAGAVEEKVDELARAAREKEDFVANFAHELKTPLTSIIGYADMLRSRRLDEEKSFLSANYIYTEGKRLEAMSLRLLDIIVTKRQEVEFQTVSTGFLFDYLEEVFAGREDIEFVFSCEKAKVRMEANLIKTVLINLVDNACKASEEKGRVEVTGKTEEKGYRFSVRDYGTGIPKEEISKITKAFYMVDKSRARSKNGAGLGLALCAEILALHGSRLKIESEPGKGSTFSFVLFVCREESA